MSVQNFTEINLIVDIFQFGKFQFWFFYISESKVSHSRVNKVNKEYGCQKAH